MRAGPNGASAVANRSRVVTMRVSDRAPPREADRGGRARARRLAGILYAMWRDGRAYDAAQLRSPAMTD